MLKITVERQDGQKDTYPVLPKTRVNFERKWLTPLGHFSQNPYDERLYWIAWDAEHVAGKVVKPFDAWLDEIAAVELEQDAPPLESQEVTSTS